MKSLLILSLVFVVACGKGPNGGDGRQVTKQSLEELEVQRVSELGKNGAKEGALELQFPLMTKFGVLKLLEDIEVRMKKESAELLLPYLFLMLEGVHNNWKDEPKDAILDRLSNLAVSNGVFEEKINLFLESEGLKEIDLTTTSELFKFVDSTDKNEQRILERKRYRQFNSFLNSSQGISYWLPSNQDSAILDKVVSDNLRNLINTQSIGSPVLVKFSESTYKLPPMNWVGTLNPDFKGQYIIKGNYIGGIKYGSNYDWGGSHGGSNAYSFITANMATQDQSNSITYSVSIITEVKGGGKKTSKGGFNDKTAKASYHLAGNVTIPGCDDLVECSPFVTVKATFKKTRGKFILKINDIEVDPTQDHLINRTQGETVITAIISGSVRHSGKSGAINDTLKASIKITQEADLKAKLDIPSLSHPSSFLVQHFWAKSFKQQLVKELLEGNAGVFIFRHLKYLDLIMKDENLSTDQLSMINVFNNFIVRQARILYYPMIKELIAEKKRTINRLPLQELSEILDHALVLDQDELKVQENNKKIKYILENDEVLRKKSEIDLSLLDISDRSLMASLYKKLSFAFDNLVIDLKSEVDFLSRQAAQLEHLFVAKEEVGSLHEEG